MAKCHGPSLTRGPRELFKFSNFSDSVDFERGSGKIGYSQANSAHCILFRGKIKNFLSMDILPFFSLSHIPILFYGLDACPLKKHIFTRSILS